MQPTTRRGAQALLALLLALFTLLGSAPSSSAAVVVPGCSAFSGAERLGSSYVDAYVRVDTCGHRPSWDGARTGAGPAVLPYAGSLVYYEGYQCIELVARYLKARFNAYPGRAHGAQAVDRYAAVYPAKFVKIRNGTRRAAPRKGDVLSLSRNRYFDDVGHTGIVISSAVNRAGDGTIRTVEQNWGGAGGSRGYHTYAVRDWRVKFAGLPHIKWLRSR